MGPLHDTSPLTGAGGEAAVSTPAHSTTMPVSSLSTNPSSYYTNASPSPPAAHAAHPPAPTHLSCDDILTPAVSTHRAPSSRSAPHSALNLHQAAGAPVAPPGTTPGRPTALFFTAEKQNAAQVPAYTIAIANAMVAGNFNVKMLSFRTQCPRSIKMWARLRLWRPY